MLFCRIGGLCQPTLEPDWQSPGQGGGTQPDQAVPALAPPPTEPVSGDTTETQRDLIVQLTVGGGLELVPQLAAWPISQGMLQN